MFPSPNQNQSTFNDSCGLQIQSTFSYNQVVDNSNQFGNNSQVNFNEQMVTSPGTFSSFFNLSDSMNTDNIDINDIFNFDATPRKRSFSSIQDGSEQFSSGKRLHVEEKVTRQSRVKVGPKNEEFQRSLNVGFMKVENRVIFSCFIDACRFKTYSADRFEKHLNNFHEDQQNILKGFCMICENFDCGVSIFDEFSHLYGHVRGPIASTSSKTTANDKIYIKKEVECEIMDETFFDNQNETILSNEDVNEDRNSPDVINEAVPENEQPQFNMETTIIPMEPSTAPNDELERPANRIPIIPIQIKQEAVPVRDDLNATMRVSAELSNNENFERPDEPVFKLPESSKSSTKKLGLSLRKRSQSTYVETNLKDTSEEKRKSQTTEDIQPLKDLPDLLNETDCLEFISKKISESKNKENDKFKHFKPTESLMNALLDADEEDEEDEEESLAARLQRNRRSTVDQKDKIRSKFNSLVEKRKEVAAKRDSLRPRKSDEVKSNDAKKSESDRQTKRKSDNEEKSSRRSKNEDEDGDISLSNFEIDQMLAKIKQSMENKKSEQRRSQRHEPESSRKTNEQDSRHKQKSLIFEYFTKDSRDGDEAKSPSKKLKETSAETDANLSEAVLKQLNQEKTPKKSRRESSRTDSDRESPRKSLRNKDNAKKSTSDIPKCPIEQNHPKYQQKQSNKPKIVEAPETAVLKDSSNSALKPSSSFNENSLDKSLNSSTKSLNLSKGSTYTVDIDALISKASSSIEFVAINKLYPWINESITSAIFKTKTSVDIMLNEFSLFSTYKCMNELCYFFTTDFEEFKKHVKSHDAINNYCSYCLKNFDKSIDLCNHIDVAHKFDRFQCNKCMYRSCQKGYVDVHQKVHHSTEENCEVLKSPVQKLLKSDRSKCIPALQKNREKLIMPYRCKTPRCREIFFCKDNFRKHLEAESSKPSNQEFVALICQQLTAIDHTRTTSNVEGIFQCLHCPFGTDEGDILEHMALNHPHEFAYICKRVKPQKLVELNIVSARETVENSTTIDYFGVTTAEAKSYEGNVEKLNSKNLGKEAKAFMKKCLVVTDVVSLDD